MSLPPLSLAVVGIDFPNKRGPSRRFEIAMCTPGEPVDLRLEPSNPADPRAVAVYSTRGIQLGYLTAERCGRIGSLIRAGVPVQAVFQGIGPSCVWIRASFDGIIPAVPERAEEASTEPDFWPNDTYD